MPAAADPPPPPPPPELPPPASGLFLEVSFRRLLASCEDITSGSSTSRPDLVDCWQRSPVFHHYVEALQEQLADLETAAGNRLQRSTLELYAARVEALASQLQPADLPAFCSGVLPQPGAAAVLQQQQQASQQHASQQQQQQPAGPEKLGGEEQRQQQGPAVGPSAAQAQAPTAAAPRLAVPAPPVVVARTPQLPVKPAGAAVRELQSSAAAATTGQAARAGAAGAAPPAVGPTSSRLQTQQQLHEDLTEELAGLAAQLKSNTQAIEGRLKERGQLLDSTEAALDTSVQRTKESKERATRVHRRGRANFCLTCLVMLIIGLAFAAMYVFIKITRLAGYRAPVPAAPVPAAGEPVQSDAVPEYEHHYAEL